MHKTTINPLAAIILLFLVLVGCGDPPKSDNEETRNTPAPTEEAVAPTPVETPPQSAEQLPPEVSTNPLLGSYVGQFEAEKINNEEAASYSNRITVFVEELREGYARGRSVVAGNFRPWEGTATYNANEGRWNFTGKEPGDDRYDGIFFFRLWEEDKVLALEWTANDGSLAVTERSGELDRKEFTYRPQNDLENVDFYDPLYGTTRMVMEDEFEFEVAETLSEGATKLNASTQRLTSADVENLYAGDLEVIRNAIYARHGYSFKNRKMRYFFDHFVDWYMPVSVDIRNGLTELEKKNIDLLKRYEEHNERYYDVFGR